jgi:hypothetical protein
MNLFIPRRREAYRSMSTGPAKTKQVLSIDWRDCISN